MDCFNPRTREGCDIDDLVVLRSSVVSIHAPAKGATDQNAVGLDFLAVSIHAPAKGATIL